MVCYGLVHVGVTTSGIVPSMPILGPGELWTEEGSFTTRNLLGSKLVSRSNDELIQMVGKSIAYSSVVARSDAFFFRGPRLVGPTLKCEPGTMCFIVAKWRKPSGWHLTNWTRPSLRSRVPKIKKHKGIAATYLSRVYGPSQTGIVFNAIYWQTTVAISTIAYAKRYPTATLTNYTFKIPILLSLDRPNGIIGIS
ncbi:hypothetical protein DSO57_1013136 [Entomophthora muscae]|uniref:Uncharacterized protein n=1 Tax=Entomophthora muscae TaxID=34485 RepID=A0ACC2SUN2_9FUNG|nr:hypothetical protein DSO57_1013136 [Entomophthora muscae]